MTGDMIPCSSNNRESWKNHLSSLTVRIHVDTANTERVTMRDRIIENVLGLLGVGGILAVAAIAGAIESGGIP